MDKKHKSKQELAKGMNMSVRTLFRRIKDLSIQSSGRLLSPRECEDLIRRIDRNASPDMEKEQKDED